MFGASPRSHRLWLMTSDNHIADTSTVLVPCSDAKVFLSLLSYIGGIPWIYSLPCCFDMQDTTVDKKAFGITWTHIPRLPSRSEDQQSIVNDCSYSVIADCASFNSIWCPGYSASCSSIFLVQDRPFQYEKLQGWSRYSYWFDTIYAKNNAYPATQQHQSPWMGFL